MAQLSALLTLPDLPANRLVAYALASYGGLRRNECRRLEWLDVDLDGEIPSIGIRHKQRSTDDPDVIPLHPYVATILYAWKQIHGTDKVLSSVPDLKTLVKDLDRAKVAFKDAKDRRLDFHGLRHTFATNLSRFGCSRATKKKLMRHASQDITDGYTHSELSEMYAALERIPSPVGVVDSCTLEGKTAENAGNPAASVYPTWVLGRTGGTIAKIRPWINFVGKNGVWRGKHGRKSRRQAHPNRAQTVARRGRSVTSAPNPGRYYLWRGIVTPRIPRITANRIGRDADQLVQKLLARSARQRRAVGLPALPIGGAQ